MLKNRLKNNRLLKTIIVSQLVKKLDVKKIK